MGFKDLIARDFMDLRASGAMLSPRMLRRTSLFLILSMALLAPCRGESRDKASHSANREGPGYVLALGVADKFLQAWQAADVESGTVLLSTSARKHLTSDMLEQYFAGHENAAYEISRGKLVKRGEYEFPVALITSATKQGIRRRFSRILIVQAGNNDWVVDKLP